MTKLVRQGDKVVRVTTDRGDLAADAYVVALGSYSARLPVRELVGLFTGFCFAQCKG